MYGPIEPPPTGFKVDVNDRGMVKNALISAIYVQVHEVDPSAQNSYSLVPLPPPPNVLPPVTFVVTTNSNSNAVQRFELHGNLQAHHSDNNSIAWVTINRRKHQGPLYDALTTIYYEYSSRY